jgi:hypothetical protein
MTDMNTELIFDDNEFNIGAELINEMIHEPLKNSVGLYSSIHGAGSFFWFNNEHELKKWLLNTLLAVETEERGADYYDNAMLLRIHLEMKNGVGNLCTSIPEGIFTENELYWTGNLLDLLTEESKFAIDFRRGFKEYLLRTEIDEELDRENYKTVYSELKKSVDPTLNHNKLENAPKSKETIELLLYYLSQNAPFIFLY